MLGCNERGVSEKKGNAESQAAQPTQPEIAPAMAYQEMRHDKVEQPPQQSAPLHDEHTCYKKHLGTGSSQIHPSIQ